MTKPPSPGNQQPSSGHQQPAPDFLLIPFEEVKSTLEKILLANKFSPEDARTCADVFATNSLEGVYSHGVNRFPKFIEYVKAGYVRPGSRALKKHGAGSVEQWDGQSGPGPVNALIATDRAMELASQYGMGCVALANTNHWMRGGTYAWKAAKAGFAYIAWSNTISNMPPWGAVDKKLGNNPLIIGVPYQQEAVVLDMALSQYSFGALEIHRQKNEQLPLPGGYDKNGNLTTDPAAIMESWRPLPIGYWKGAGLSLLLDILATILSGGLSTAAISAQNAEHHLSQVFIAVDLSRLHNYTSIGQTLHAILADYASATPIKPGDHIRYPGEGIVRTRKENSEKGIPILRATWESVIG
jgi:3-dehydro-L-gulonate 2-dehydrogenase